MGQKILVGRLLHCRRGMRREQLILNSFTSKKQHLTWNIVSNVIFQFHKTEKWAGMKEGGVNMTITRG